MNNGETKLALLQIKRKSNFSSEHYLFSSASSEVIFPSFRRNI